MGEGEGLTEEEYQFLLDDIEEAIAEGNRKYGFGESGYIDADGNFYPFPDNDKPKNIGHVKPKSKSKPKPKRKRRPSVEQVAIARGIIKVIPSPPPLVPLKISTESMGENH